MSKNKKPTSLKASAPPRKKTVPVAAGVQKPKTVKPPKPKKAAAPKAPVAKPSKPRRVVSAKPKPLTVPLAAIPSQTFVGRIRAYLRTPAAAKLFAAASVVVLLLTTIFWSVLTARLHQANADQLIDSYLFENVRTFQGAVFPGAHSFLIKWPLFILVELFGAGASVFMAATILTTLITVAFLAYLLHRIEGRPEIFGLLCLALASILLLVPAQPYPGALLPVNMAMTTTRNLEYVVFIAALCLAIRAPRIKSRSLAGAAVLLGLLIASDKLFLVLTAGAALFAGLCYALAYRKSVFSRPLAVMVAVRLAGILIIAASFAAGVLLVLSATGVTNIHDGGSSSPYAFVHQVTQLGTGLAFAAAAILTNLGANPVHAVMVVRRMPGALLESFHHVTILAYVVNLLLSGVGMYTAVRLLVSLRRRVTEHMPVDGWDQLAILLLGSTGVALAIFILTDHYYPVDARYLTIGLFAVFVSAAAYVRRQAIRPVYAAAAAAVILAILPLGILSATREYQADNAAMAGRGQVTARVSDELQRRKVDRLIGNYWDVTPVKGASERHVTVSPVDNCTLPRPVLNSSAWFKQPAKTSTAFLAIKDGSAQAGPDNTRKGEGTTYGGCSLAHVVGAYGTPSERVAIGQQSGPEKSPDVLLLLYPGGIKQPGSERANNGAKGAVAAQSTAPQVAEMQSLVPFTDREVCTNGTSLQIVAHQDDDILFMNPDVLAGVKAGTCMRTLYLTAGDAGEDVRYWGQREQGAKAAYSQMYGVPYNWRDEQQMLAGHPVTVSYLADVPQVSLVFLRLPDGNMRGEGFAGHAYSSLQSVLGGVQSEIIPVDGAPAYTKQALLDCVLEIMIKDLPDQIRTLGSDDVADGDHADHHDAGILTQLAAQNYLQPHELRRYLGYPDKALPVNLSDDDITIKQATFLAYAKFDGAVCQTAFECQNTYTYGSYLSRLYPAAPPAASP
jgi:hypothetical protein